MTLVHVLLSSVQVAQLVKSTNPAIVIQDSATVAQACAVLAEHQISSAPVYDSKDHAFKGLVDFRDLCALLIKAIDHDKLDSLEQFLKGGDVGNLPVKLAADLSLQNPLRGVNLQDDVAQVVENEFIKNQVHRVCVFEQGGGFVGMLSQSDIVKFIFEHFEQTKSDIVWTKNISELGMGNKRSAITIDGSKSVKEAIQLMNSERVSSVGLTDEEVDGKLVGTFSISDIKYLLKANKLEYLNASCADYISSVRQFQSLEEHHGKDVFPVFSVHQHTKFADLVAKLVATHTHRMFVTEHGKAIGVVTLADVLEAII
jgi:CBS domain containing-hemolysin-like protein